MKRAPDGFRYVGISRDEMAEWRAKHPRRPSGPGVYRLECLSCGKRIWGSGLGVGAHRRGCTGMEPEREEA